MQVLAKLPDDLPQIVRVLLDQPARFFQASGFGIRRLLIRARLFCRFHVLTVGESETGPLAMVEMSVEGQNANFSV